jgi:hypothetical protein
MKLTHQVYVQLPNGGRMWVASTTSLQQAGEYVRTLNSTSDSTYSIVDMRLRRPVEAPEIKAVKYREHSVGLLTELGKYLKRWIGFWRITINALTGS